MSRPLQPWLNDFYQWESRRILATLIRLLGDFDLAEEAADEADGDDACIEDDRLRLVFTCCHPGLSPEAQLALTLREVCGLIHHHGPAHCARQGQDSRRQGSLCRAGTGTAFPGPPHS